MIGPQIVPMPNTAMARPWRSGGLICSSVACDSGTRPAPATPCSARKKTSSPRLAAAPHSAEATVKPTTEPRKIYLMPKRPASQPVSGIMIAAQTIYEVSAQAIWSSEADRLPWTCGRATLRIELSTPCMMFAIMIESVSMPRLGTGANASPLTADAPRAASSSQPAPHPLATSPPSPGLTRGAWGEGWAEGLSGGAITYPARAQLETRNPLGREDLADENDH